MQTTIPTQQRKALIAGATGLIGRALLPMLYNSPHYGEVHVLLRRSVAGLGKHEKSRVHVVDFAQLPQDLPAVDHAYIALGTTIKVAGSQAAFRSRRCCSAIGPLSASPCAPARYGRSGCSARSSG
jgi:uncharacterized protein YbjT (DUF2867 family)